MSELSGKTTPAITTKPRGRRPAQIRVTTVGKLPLSGAAAFARLLAAVHEAPQPGAMEDHRGGEIS